MAYVSNADPPREVRQSGVCWCAGNFGGGTAAFFHGCTTITVPEDVDHRFQSPFSLGDKWSVFAIARRAVSEVHIAGSIDHGQVGRRPGDSTPMS